MERQPINDATLPILADGIKWLGYVPKAKILWNLGVFGDAVSEGQTFLDLREPDLGTIRMGADTLTRRRKSVPHRRERPLRQDEGRKAPAESSSGSLGSSFLRGRRRIRCQPLSL